MSSHPFQRERLEELLFASTNETFSEEERDELNAMLRGSEAARSLAAQFLLQGSGLERGCLPRPAAGDYRSTLGRMDSCEYTASSWCMALANLAYRRNFRALSR